MPAFCVENALVADDETLLEVFLLLADDPYYRLQEIVEIWSHSSVARCNDVMA